MTSSLRLLRPFSSQLIRTTARVPQIYSCRLLNTSTAPILYSAHAKVKGATNGVVDGEGLSLGLTMSKALGGPEETGKSNPEELFAAGWGACFQSSMYVSAASLGIKFPTGVDDSIVETTVHLVGDAKKLDMGMRVDMDVRVRGMEKEDFDKVISKAREMCPYIRATNGNVEVKFNASQL